MKRQNWHCIASAVALSLHLSGAWALADNPQQIPVTGARLWGGDIFYDPSVTIMPQSFTGVTHPFRGFLDIDTFFEWREMVLLAKIDPLNTTDMRCSALTTAATRQTTSRSDLTSRFLAANQLFTAIGAVKGVAGLRTIISGSRPALYSGRYHATFSVTYVDGGNETWVVAPGVVPTLIIEAALPPPPTGNGTPQPCI